ncbi:hypothetical protein AB0M39_01300 [Streptomyces sp. NPDC051907]|uniref:hypothetical protein n=1 Tax=Streptomyces sp. NPDC051907 TaxID=3155284 RepID=UPI003437ACE8
MTTIAVQQQRRHQEAKAAMAAADPRPQYRGLFLEPHYDVDAFPQSDAEIGGPHSGDRESLRD